MAKLDPEKVKRFEASTQACLKSIQALYKARKWSGLAASLTDDTVLILAKSQNVLAGKIRIIDFWRRQRAKGLQDVKFRIQKMTTRPADFLHVTETGYFQYDMVTQVFGRFAFKFQKRGGRVYYIEGGFAFDKSHQNICMGRLRTIYLDF